MLRRLCAEKPKEWDRFLPALLFAYREVPQSSLGFSPFELIYGRSVRGPLAILHDLWVKDADEEVKTTYEYIIDLRNRLESTCQLAQSELAKSAARYKGYYDSRSRDRKFAKGDLVLLLLPTDNNKLLLQWKGPFEIEQRVGKNDYKVKQAGKTKIYHANLLKRYVTRAQYHKDDAEVASSTVCLETLGAGVIEVDSETDQDAIIELPLEQKESVKDVNVGDCLKDIERKKVNKLLNEYTDVLTDLPGKTDLLEYAVTLTTDDPVRSRPYPAPHALRETIKSELDAMLRMGVIEPSTSKYASPIVMVRKKDNSNRFCVDYRKLNSVTLVDPEPIPNIEDLMSRISAGRYFSKLDLTKGYWQIPVTECDKDKTAFVTTEGLYQFTVLPFGMVNAPAAFTRMMRRLLNGQTT
ncbi:hypothetical protein BSL78_04608 [Apostichopus japonicus]|uniref:Reverse transcriptase domain-containing protein n=1 Tax=Stichopus japonicus TaxID=307972 RepID=A0A2G8LE41_STIJA|nr:hypothetical protein BSL78_04608 [Apostichopus japonicus]